jgi:ADP-heptose:LPS heptosyltransferase
MSGERILALRAGALGDTLLVLPAIAALRSRVGPAGSVELVGRAPAIELCLGAGLATRVHSIERSLFLPFFQESADDRELRSFLKPFDRIVAWTEFPLVEKGEIPLLRASPRPPPGVHASDHLFAALAPLGIRGPAPTPSLEIDRGSRLAALAFLEKHGISPAQFIALHPSSGSARKNWPKERFRELASKVVGDGLRLVWIEGEADREVVASLSAATESAVARDLPLKVLAALLAQGRGFVGNDSGVTHLAAAAGARTLALFGPTDAAQWGPRGPFVRILDLQENAEEVWGSSRSWFSEP